MDETRLTGSLPNLDLEIIRRDAGDGRETVIVTMTGTPTLGHAALGLLGHPALVPGAFPGPMPGMSGFAPGAGLPAAMGAWIRVAEAAWRPWLTMAVSMNPLLAAMMAPGRRD